jgi:serine/threonine protein kinase
MRRTRVSWLIAYYFILFGCGHTLIKIVEAQDSKTKGPHLRKEIHQKKKPPGNSLKLPPVHAPTPDIGPFVPGFNYTGVLRELSRKVGLLSPVKKGDKLYIAKRYFREYLRSVGDLSRAEKEPHRDIDPECPPRTLTISWNNKTYSFAPGEFIARGSDSRVYRSALVPDLGTLITKSLGFLRDPKTNAINLNQTLSQSVKLALLQDKAFMVAFNDYRDLVPHTYHLERGSMTAYCHSLTIVSENVGATELGDLYKWVRTTPRVLYSIAAAALKIIKQIHKTGLLHGDIHKRNWLVQDWKRPAETLRIIDFGRVELFMQPDSTNPRQTILIPDVVNRQIPTSLNWNAYHLSPWEMQGHRLTRRDDVFRIAEMLVRLYGEDSGFIEKHNDAKKKRNDAMRINEPAAIQAYLTRVIRLKKKRPFNPHLPKLLKEFYQYTLGLAYHEEPDYDTWIGVFKYAPA